MLFEMRKNVALASYFLSKSRIPRVEADGASSIVNAHRLPAFLASKEKTALGLRSLKMSTKNCGYMHR
jgi:hypothetical protein